MKKKHDVDDVLKPMYHEGHRLKTRRDFLAQGFLGMTAFALAPSALSLLSSSAHAAECSPAIISHLTPVIIIDLAGGGNIAGSNVMVGGAGGQMDFLANYASLGLPNDFHPSKSGQVNTEMGLAFHSGSGILQGIRNITSQGTRDKTEGAIFCSTSDDDTGNNQSNPIYWLHKAGAKGSLTQLAGTQQTDSGGNSTSPIDSINPAVAPVRITSRQEAINLVSTGNVLGSFSETKVKSILNAASRISERKLAGFSRRSLPEQVQALVACGFSESSDQLYRVKSTDVDPNNDTDSQTIFNKINNQDVRNRSRAITKLVLEGRIGVGTITLGGFDYHDGTRTTGDTKDFELGQLMGAIMELAAVKDTDVVIYVLTDGGVAAGGTVDGSGKFIWSGDSGQRSSTFMMVYKKDGRPGLRTTKRQIGYFKANGAVEGSALLTSNSVVTTSKAMVANYLALHGLEGNFENVVGDDPFRNNLDRYLVFDKLR
ncbi:hypothetical protein [Peredibacter starrii]|uniref:General secretion pathway protein GspF n=1 Tax=Peredibacter starrii TaxID=28202 RepID=A0AAX4HJJ9_9BACT|nr:hypothetical protein [Peredibacter starrii]WPU63376.1 hypothetical protein SOO65_11830 [Peredibacter starrii]